MEIRPARGEDAQALLDIYAPYVRDTAVTFDYDVPTVAEFQQRIAGITRKYPYLVAEENGRILGYAYASVFKDRAAYARSVETTIYVQRDQHGRGVGRALYEALEEKLRQMGILNAYACIAWSDTEDETLTHDSMRFHAHMGYRLCGTFRQCGYKFGRWYDMIWMEKMLGPHETR